MMSLASKLKENGKLITVGSAEINCGKIEMKY
jgi:hypothetical protein